MVQFGSVRIFSGFVTITIFLQEHVSSQLASSIGEHPQGADHTLDAEQQPELLVTNLEDTTEGIKVAETEALRDAPPDAGATVGLRFPRESVVGLVSLGTRQYVPLLQDRIARRKAGDTVVVYGSCLEAYCALQGKLPIPLLFAPSPFPSIFLIIVTI